MKKLVIIAVSVLLFNIQGFAQNKLPERANSFNIGFQLNSYQNDFGLGLQLTSPFFAHGYFAIR